MAQTKVFADRIYTGEGIAADAARIVAANLLMVLCAQIAIPLPWTPVPITGQTFGVLLVAILLGGRRAALALGLYLLEGAGGLPVFQPYGLPGAARFFGPTAGYLLSYPVAGLVAGTIAERGKRGAARLAAALGAGEAIIFAGGCAWLAVGIGLGWRASFTQGALPFLPGEVIKMALVAAAVGGMEFARREKAGSSK
ncbi:MAG: biotin transporter BioY [Candidatus Acidiferrales bacterium]